MPWLGVATPTYNLLTLPTPTYKFFERSCEVELDVRVVLGNGVVIISMSVVLRMIISMNHYLNRFVRFALGSGVVIISMSVVLRKMTNANVRDDQPAALQKHLSSI